MATTTTNYGFDIPQSTDLVKDGATAIATLGQDIDTAMNTALGTKKAGMVLLNTTSFSGVASQTLPANTFTSAYANYRVIIKAKSDSANQNASVRMVTAGTPNSSAIYNKQHLDVYGGTVSGAQYNGQTAMTDLFVVSLNYDCYTIFDLFSPQATNYTSATVLQNLNNSGSSTQFRLNFYNTSATTSFDSLQIYPNTSGNITGSVTVYGYNA